MSGLDWRYTASHFRPYRESQNLALTEVKTRRNRCLVSAFTNWFRKADFAAKWWRKIHYGRIYSSLRRLLFHLQWGKFIPEAAECRRSQRRYSVKLSHTLDIWGFFWDNKKKNSLRFLPKARCTITLSVGLICKNKPQTAQSERVSV